MLSDSVYIVWGFTHVRAVQTRMSPHFSHKMWIKLKAKYGDKMRLISMIQYKYKYKFFIHSGLQCNQHEVHNFTYIFYFYKNNKVAS